MIEFLTSNAWRAWTVSVIALLFFTLGNLQGSSHARDKCMAEKAAAEIHTSHVETVQAQTTVDVVTKYAQRASDMRARSQSITSKVSHYVPTKTDSSACALPSGWRLLHDAAATGELPITTSGADAAVVTPQEAASTVSDNYATCRANALQLDALQEWVRKQAEVTRE